MPFKCPECQTSFRHKKNLNQHLKSAHGHKPFQCTECKNAYTNQSDLSRHVKTKHVNITYNCKECDFTSSRKDKLNRHIRDNHSNKNMKCDKCEFRTNRKENLQRHIREKHVLKECNECEFATYVTAELKKHKSSHVPDDIEEESAFKKLVYKKTWKIRELYGPLSALSSYKRKVRTTISDYKKEKGNMKWYLGLVVQLAKLDRFGEKMTVYPGFTARPNLAFNLDNFDNHYDKSASKIERDFEQFLQNGSGWVLERVVNILVNIGGYKPFYKKRKDVDSKEIEKPSNGYESEGSPYVYDEDESIWRDVFE